MEYRRSSHAVFGLQYHIVLVTKYRRKCISGGDRGAVEKGDRPADRRT